MINPINSEVTQLLLVSVHLCSLSFPFPSRYTLLMSLKNLDTNLFLSWTIRQLQQQKVQKFLLNVTTVGGFQLFTYMLANVCKYHLQFEYSDKEILSYKRCTWQIPWLKTQKVSKAYMWDIWECLYIVASSISAVTIHLAILLANMI